MSYVPDTPPAKLWELLRRNARFQRTVKRMQTLEAARQGGDQRRRDRATGHVDRALSFFARHNPCAEIALRWLAFPPLFVRREVACEIGREADLHAGRTIPIETVRLGWSRHPHVTEKTKWTFFKSEFPPDSACMGSAESKANFNGRPHCLGPEIETVTCGEPRLQHLCRDEIAEWTAYFTKRRRFTFETAWLDAPSGFQREFSAQWSRLCGKGAVAESSFFRDWNLVALVARASRKVAAANRLVRDLAWDLDRVSHGESEKVCPPVPTKGGGALRNVPQVGLTLTKAEMLRLFMFDDLASHRVFALPHLLTKEDVEPVLAELKRQLLDGLPDSHELLGTSEFWKDFVAVDAIERTESVDTGEAIRRQIYRSPEMLTALAQGAGLPRTVLARHFRNGALSEPGKEATTQVKRRVDQDGVATLFRYNAKGELEITAVDVDDNKVVDETGKDRVTKTVTSYFAANAAPDNNQTVPLRRTEMSVLGTDNSDAWTVVQRSDAALNGLATWRSVRKNATTWVTSSNVTAYGTGGARTVTSYAPDNTHTVQNYSNGRLTTVTEQNSSQGQITQTTYQYDAYGRQWKVTDTRNGTITYGYKANTDLLETVTTPVPGNGQPAQSTTTVYDNLQRPKKITQSDGTVVSRDYFPTGLLKKTWGSRTYPVEYTYDAQGRMLTMKTWQNYAGTSGAATTTWKYHSRRGWLYAKRYADPATGTETANSVGPDYKYTKGGRLFQHFWAREYAAGQRIYTQYKYGISDTPPTTSTAT